MVSFAKGLKETFGRPLPPPLPGAAFAGESLALPAAFRFPSPKGTPPPLGDTTELMLLERLTVAPRLIVLVEALSAGNRNAYSSEIPTRDDVLMHSSSHGSPTMLGRRLSREYAFRRATCLAVIGPSRRAPLPHAAADSGDGGLGTTMCVTVVLYSTKCNAAVPRSSTRSRATSSGSNP